MRGELIFSSFLQGDKSGPRVKQSCKRRRGGRFCGLPLPTPICPLETICQRFLLSSHELGNMISTTIQSTVATWKTSRGRMYGARSEMCVVICQWVTDG